MTCTNFKILWEELIELLEEMLVPKVLWHQSAKLYDYILEERYYWHSARRALEIICEIAPIELPEFGSVIDEKMNTLRASHIGV